MKAAVPHLISGGQGGSIVLTSSVGGLKAYPNTGHYIAAKHGVIGLMRTFAVELGQHSIRVNCGMSHQRQHTHVHERGHDAAVPARPRRTRVPTIWPWSHSSMHVLPDRLGRACRHQQCRAVPGLQMNPATCPSRPPRHGRRGKHVLKRRSLSPNTTVR